MSESQTARNRRTQQVGLDPEVGRRIRAARQERGMTLAQVGGEEVSRSFLSAVETGRNRISVRTLGIVAERLQLPVSYFLEGTDTDSDGTTILILERAETAFVRWDWQECLRLLETLDVPSHLRARAIYLQGAALIDGGSVSAAVAHLQDALPLAHGAGDFVLVQLIEYRLGLALYTGKVYDEALVHFRQVLDTQNHYDDPVLRGKATVCIGHILYVRRDMEGALTYYGRAKELFGTGADWQNLASVYSGLSLVYEQQGDVRQSLRYSRMSLGVFESQRNIFGIAVELNNMAVKYRKLGDLDRALASAQEALARAQQASSLEMEASVQSTLASIYFQQQDWVQAQQAAETAVRLAPDERALGRIDAWVVLAQIAHHNGDHDRADELFQQALDALHRVEQTSTYAAVALMYTKLLQERGETEQALEYALKAAETNAALQL